MDLALSGRSVLVTGGGSGIGRACAELFAAEGARVLTLDLRGDVDLVADVTDEGAVRAAVDRAAERHGGLDVVVCCAGISGPVGTAATEVSVADWDAVFAVNVRGPFLVAKHAARHLAAASSPAIVMLGSDSAVVAAPGMAPYCASKGALLMLARALSVDLAQDGIRVNCVCPSVVDTPMSRADLGVVAEGFADAPFPVQTAQDVARQVAFLASPASASVNGTHLLADFGTTARSSLPA
jgi:dihydroanticapsin dehydrogenase